MGHLLLFVELSVLSSAPCAPASSKWGVAMQSRCTAIPMWWCLAWVNFEPPPTPTMATMTLLQSEGRNTVEKKWRQKEKSSDI